MKFNKLIIFLVFFFALIIAFGFYLFWNTETALSDKHLVAIILSFLISFVSLSSYALKSTNRQRANWSKNAEMEKSVSDYDDIQLRSDFSERVVNLLKVISTLYFFIGILSIITLCLFIKTGASLIFAYGLLTVIYLLIAYSISKSGQ